MKGWRSLKIRVLKKEERLGRVAELLRKGYPLRKIARLEKVSRQQIHEDKKIILKISSGWDRQLIKRMGRLPSRRIYEMAFMMGKVFDLRMRQPHLSIPQIRKKIGMSTSRVDDYLSLLRNSNVNAGTRKKLTGAFSIAKWKKEYEGIRSMREKEILKLRLNDGLTEVEIARKTGIKQPHISEIIKNAAAENPFMAAILRRGWHQNKRVN